MKWTSGDNLHARDAIVIGGPNHGLRIAVREKHLVPGEGRIGTHKHPNVIDMSEYTFDEESWQWTWRG